MRGFAVRYSATKDGVLTIEHIAAYTTPYLAICDICAIVSLNLRKNMAYAKLNLN